MALAAGGAIAARRGEPVGTAAAPSASPVAEPLLSAHFGFLWADGTEIQAIPEGGGGTRLPAHPYGFSLCGCTIDPDGARIAYWTNFTTGPSELRVMELRDLARSMTIYTAPPNYRIAAAAWSSDGTGLVAAIEANPTKGEPDAGPSHSSMLAIEADGTGARVLVDRGGAEYVPMGWDRRVGVAAAAQSGPGGYVASYLTVHTGGDPMPQRTAITEEIRVLSLDVSTDQQYVLGVAEGRTTTLRWWKLTDFGSMVSGPSLSGATSPRWRPSTWQIAWAGLGHVQLLDVAGGQSRALKLPAGVNVVSGFRHDGSVVLLNGAQGYLLVELASGRSASLPSAGSPVGSVRFP